MSNDKYFSEAKDRALRNSNSVLISDTVPIKKTALVELTENTLIPQVKNIGLVEGFVSLITGDKRIKEIKQHQIDVIRSQLEEEKKRIELGLERDTDIYKDLLKKSKAQEMKKNNEQHMQIMSDLNIETSETYSDAMDKIDSKNLAPAIKDILKEQLTKMYIHTISSESPE